MSSNASRRLPMTPVWAAALILSGAAIAQTVPPPAGQKPTPPAQQPAPPAQAPPAPKPPPTAVPDNWSRMLQWRGIGPANMGGRITSISVYEKDPNIYWVGTAAGGLVKTSDNGTTFVHQFDHQEVASIGSVCVAPSDPKIVWVGTGENNPRNSVSYGNGVYKSTDGGTTWTHMGLEKTFQIGAVRIDPTNPDIVYVGALGRLYGPNPDRGLYKTTDGGKTWKQILKLDDDTGVIDIAMKPDDPKTLLVAAWDRKRDEFDDHPGPERLPDGIDSYDPIVKWGPKAGIYRTTDGGETFTKVSKGLPTADMGRVGLDFYRKDPKVVFAIIDCAESGMGPVTGTVYIGVTGDDVKEGVKIGTVTADSPAAKAGLKVGDILNTLNAKPLTHMSDLTAAVGAAKAGQQITLGYLRDMKQQSVQVLVADKPPDPIPTNRMLGAAPEDGTGGVRLRFVFGQDNDFVTGDIITAIDGDKTANTKDLDTVIHKHKPGDKVDCSIVRGGKPMHVSLVVGPADEEERKKRPYNGGYFGQRENVQGSQGADGYRYGGVYRSEDAGVTWKRINSVNPRPMYFSCVRVDPTDEKNIYVTGVEMYRSSDGGATFRNDGSRSVHADQHALWLDPRDGRHMIIGCDGGFYVSYDGANHWQHLNIVDIGQYYSVAVDGSAPYNVIGGLQDNGSWYGPSRSLTRTGVMNSDWRGVGGGDGFVGRIDQRNPEWIYSESQGGFISRRNLRTGFEQFIRPQRKPGTHLRFNWNTPFILSSRNPGIFYAAGNYVFRSVEQGDNAKMISPEISRTKWGSASALVESPVNPDVLWAGTDDGNLWITKDGGANWTNVAEKVGLKGPRYVSSIEASRVAEGRAYVVFDAHRSDDDSPYVYVTEDFGATWKSLRANLPDRSTLVLREDRVNPDLLYLGTEFDAWFSVNRGGSWTRFGGVLPTCPVREFAQPPNNNEVVAATHGRSLWILDATPLRTMTLATVAAPATLYAPDTAVRWRTEPEKGSFGDSGDQYFRGADPPEGARLYYSLTAAVTDARLRVYDVTGNVIRELSAVGDPGLQMVVWDLRNGQNAPVPSGYYRVSLTAGGKEYAQVVHVENDPTLRPGEQSLREPLQPVDPDETGGHGG